jgi:hypothetical protein
VKEEQQSESSSEKKPLGQESDFTSGASDAKESRRKRKTIRIKIPRKPAAPRRATRTPISAVVRSSRVDETARANDAPLRITCFVIVILLALAYCNFFFEFVRFVPLREDLPRIFWPQVIHKLLGISLLVGFGLFERTGKELSSRSRWMYCLVLAFGTAFFAAQWIIHF